MAFPAVNPPSPGARFLVLIVDDEPDIFSSFAMLIENAMPGVKVLTAESGRIGLDLLAREPVDCVVSDFRMPSMDGIEFLREVRRLYPAVPRIMYSAYPSDELAKRARDEASVQSFVAKGENPRKILDAVREALPALRTQSGSP